MRALSTLATIISVLSFPLGFIALLYPNIVSPKSRWRGVILYFGVSLGALFVAVLTAPHPSIAEEEWILGDWIVLGVGGGLTIAFLIREFWLPKKKMLRESAPEGTGGSKHIKKLRPGKKRVILESSA